MLNRILCKLIGHRYALLTYELPCAVCVRCLVGHQVNILKGW